MGKVIITADDYGACKYIDDGIERALNGGHINTVSTFVTHKRSEEGIKQLNKKRKENLKSGKNIFNIGLHFSITSGFSLQNKDTSLTVGPTDSLFYFREAKNYPFDSIENQDLENELIAQLNQLDKWLGDDAIDHVTVHHGVVYLDPDLFGVFINTIANYKGLPGSNKYAKPIPIRSPMSWFRAKKVPNCCYDPGTGDKMLLSEIITEGLELGFWKRYSETTLHKMEQKKGSAQNIGLNSTDYLVDVIYDQCCVEGLSCLLKTLSTNDITAEFMLHLGFQEGVENLDERDFDAQVVTEHGINKKYFLKRMVEELRTIEEMNLAQKIREMGIDQIFYSNL